MKSQITLITFCILLYFHKSEVLAQHHLDVDGNGKILGKLELSTADSISLFIGVEAGRDYTGGNPNLGIGRDAGQRVTDGFSNTFVGNLAGRVTIGGYFNTFLGHAAGFLNTASNNTFLGAVAGIGNTDGFQNTFVGAAAGQNNKTSSNSTFVGYLSGGFQKTGGNNTYIGAEAGASADECQFNTFVGTRAGYTNSTGFSNTLIGFQAGYSTTTGWDNVIIGRSAGFATTTGDANTIVGLLAGRYNTSGSDNTFLGWQSGFNNTTGLGNIYIGHEAGSNNQIGSYNVAVGRNAGNRAIAHFNCSFLGDDADFNNNNSYANSTALGNAATLTAGNQVRIGNSVVSSIGGYANWTNVSDSRYKTDLKADVPGLDFILKLRPVTYNLDLDKLNHFLHEDRSFDNSEAHFKRDSLMQVDREAKSRIRYTGFLAQEVEAAAESIHYDFSGVDKPQNENSLYGLRYAEFVVPLVKAVQELNESQSDQLVSVDKIMMENQALREENRTIMLKLQELEQLVKSFNNLLETTTERVMPETLAARD